jgi:hypothetical protein
MGAPPPPTSTPGTTVSASDSDWSVCLQTISRLVHFKSKLCYDWQFTANQFVLTPSPLRFTTRILFFQLKPYGYSPPWRKGGFVSYVYACFLNVSIAHITCCYNLFFCTIHKSSVSPGFAKQIMPILFILCYKGSLVAWMYVCLTSLSYFLCLAAPRPVYCERVHSHDFVCLLLVACTILLYNRIHKEDWKPCENREFVCTLENFQCCGQPCFIGAAILRVLPLIPRREKHKSLLNWSVL